MYNNDWVLFNTLTLAMVIYKRSFQLQQQLRRAGRDTSRRRDEDYMRVSVGKTKLDHVLWGRHAGRNVFLLPYLLPDGKHVI